MVLLQLLLTTTESHSLSFGLSEIVSATGGLKGSWLTYQPVLQLLQKLKLSVGDL